ncbi:MAG: aldo/keto reductase [Chloroflexota bacterium]|nr:aldo/keto reductase [Chloroflexota bacterium]
MEKVLLGKTGLEVSRLGIGLSEIGSSDEETSKKILNTALDNGINFFDTSSCYGKSEEFVGENLSKYRNDIILASKCGHSSRFDSSLPDWSYEGIKKSIDRSLTLLQTDRVDIMQLHSCGVDTLEKGEVIKALEEAKSDGKIIHLGFSGDNDAAIWAAESNKFETIQTSFNLVEQKARYKLFDLVDKNELGLIAKRPIANGAWRANENPNVHSAPTNYAEEYFNRAGIMNGEGSIINEPKDRIMTSMGYTFSFNDIDVGIIGTQNPKHLLSNIDMYKECLEMPKEVVNELNKRFDKFGKNWDQRT